MVQDRCFKEKLDKYFENNKLKLNLWSVDFDDCHVCVIISGEEAEYQSRKKRKITNALYLSNRQGLPLAISNPVAVTTTTFIILKFSLNSNRNIGTSRYTR